jgi:hypothetical protein
MSDNFTGDNEISLQPNDNSVPYGFSFSPCTTPTANDGSLPFGANISSIVVTGHMSSGTDATSALIANYTLDANVVTVYLKYPTAKGPGTYHLKFVATLDSGAVMQFAYNNLSAAQL